MYRVICFADGLLTKLLALVLLMALGVGVYFIYDTAYVFYFASADRVSASRPGGARANAEAGKKLTEDYLAWITLDGTSIDYPVMQGDDNDTYLNRDPYGEYSLSGSIFLDSRNAPDFSDGYSLIYGHHMDGDLMFGALDKFYNESYFQRHRTGELIVDNIKYPLVVFAVLTADAKDAEVFEPQDRETVLQFARNAAIYYEEDWVSEHIMALTTCVDGTTTTRTVVLCALSDPYIQE